MPTINETFLTDIHFDKDLVKVGGTGDLEDISGLDNVHAALLRRLVTYPGTVVHRPDYGCGILQFQGAPNTLATQRKIALAIDEQFTQDPRVEKVLGVRCDSSDDRPELVTIIVRVKLIGYGDTALTFSPFDSGDGS